MFGTEFLAMFAALFDDDDYIFLSDEEEDHRKRGDPPRGDQYEGE
jgi:hypothetical protein